MAGKKAVELKDGIIKNGNVYLGDIHDDLELNSEQKAMKMKKVKVTCFVDKEISSTKVVVGNDNRTITRVVTLDKPVILEQCIIDELTRRRTVVVDEVEPTNFEDDGIEKHMSTRSVPKFLVEYL